jgi:tetratricopeptide (TPR) repeat protein
MAPIERNGSHREGFPEPGLEASSGSQVDPDPGGAAPAAEPPPSPLSARRRRPLRSLCLGALAIAAIVISGVVVYPIVREELARRRAGTVPAAARPAVAKGGTAARPMRDEPDPGEVRTRLAILHPGGEGDGMHPPVVALGRPTGPNTVAILGFTKQPTLYREIVRQGVLIAARDELGLSTRDEVLDNVPPAPGEGAPIELATVCRDFVDRAVIRRGEPGKADVLLQLDLADRSNQLNFAARLAKAVEQRSRTDFLEVLKKLGFSGTPNPVRDEGPVPAVVEKELRSLSLVDHFAAIRTLHRVIRTEGESPARLAALARAYAQLGVLTEYQWSAAHRAFKARAMLYAARLRARDPKSPWAVWNQAFVRALVGFPFQATRLLEQAGKLAATRKDASPAPSWLPVLDAYLKNDLHRLGSEDGPHAALAALLKMIAVEYPPHTRLAVRAARKAVDVDHDCYRAYDVICESGQLNDLHVATVAGADAFTDLLPVKLKALGSLPERVRQPLDQRRDEPTLVDALDRAGRPGEDSGEPSWGALAQLAREVRFVQAWRRLYFMAEKWSVPVDEYWATVQPFVAKHRYYPFLESYVLPPRQAKAAMARLGDTLDPTDVETRQLALVWRFRTFGVPIGEHLWGFCFAHCQSGAGDHAAIAVGSVEKRPEMGDILLALHPYSAYAMELMIERDWEHAKDKVAGWRRKVHDHPTLLAALGRKYIELKRYPEAEECLRRSVEQSPDRQTYEALASCYEARGDPRRWKAILDEYLAKTEDAGLEHAQVRVNIAEFLMKEGRYQEAQPYATAAASTWAGWAMACAQRCAEGLGDWETAERYARACSERYPGSMWSVWFVFCERTGHGDLAGARSWTKDFTASLLGDPDLDIDQLLLSSYVQLLCGDKAKAVEALRRFPTDSNDLVYAASAAAACDLAGMPDRRDAALAHFCAAYATQAPKTTKIFQIIRDGIAAKESGLPNLEAIDAILASIPNPRKGNSAYLVAARLTANGHLAEAKPYWLMTAASGQSNYWWRVIALSILRERYPGDPTAKVPPEATLF